MTKQKVTASSGGIAVGGDNSGDLFAVTATDHATVNINVEQRIARELPSFLSSIVVLFAEQSLSEYGGALRHELAVEIIDKLQHNRFSTSHYLIADYVRYSSVLEQVFRGVEQENSDARRLVRRRVSVAYSAVLGKSCNEQGVKEELQATYVRQNAVALVKAVIKLLMDEYAASNSIKVHEESADLAVSLLVIDTAIACEILERPTNVATA
jgi:Glu-tRNA(Gln) amidotransferase subunit E-like FAD-binding protein